MIVISKNNISSINYQLYKYSTYNYTNIVEDYIKSNGILCVLDNALFIKTNMLILGHETFM